MKMYNMRRKTGETTVANIQSVWYWYLTKFFDFINIISYMKMYNMRRKTGETTVANIQSVWYWQLCESRSSSSKVSGRWRKQHDLILNFKTKFHVALFILFVSGCVIN